jgi:hypothetical protein
MKRFTGKFLMEIGGGAVAMIGAVIAAISSASDKTWFGVYVGVGMIVVGWAAFSISQIEEK